MSEEPRFIKTELVHTGKATRASQTPEGTIPTHKVGANVGEAVIPTAVAKGDLKGYLLSNPSNPRVNLRADAAFQHEGERTMEEARVMAILIDSAALKVAHRHGFRISPRPGDKDFRTGDFMWTVRSPQSNRAKGIRERINPSRQGGEPWEEWGVGLVNINERGNDGHQYQTETDQKGLIQEVLREAGFLGESEGLPPATVGKDGRAVVSPLKHPDLPYQAQLSPSHQSFLLQRVAR